MTTTKDTRPRIELRPYQKMALEELHARVSVIYLVLPAGACKTSPRAEKETADGCS